MVDVMKNVKGRGKSNEQAEGAAVLLQTQVRPCDVVTDVWAQKKEGEANPSHFSSDIAEEIHLTIEFNGVEIVL